MRKRFIVTSICLLALGSCATGAPHYYNKPGVTLASYKETEEECIEAIKNVQVPSGYNDGSVAGAIGAGIGRGIAKAMAKQRAYETCMLNNGYEKVEISHALFKTCYRTMQPFETPRNSPLRETQFDLASKSLNISSKFWATRATTTQV